MVVTDAVSNKGTDVSELQSVNIKLVLATVVIVSEITTFCSDLIVRNKLAKLVIDPS